MSAYSVFVERIDAARGALREADVASLQTRAAVRRAAALLCATSSERRPTYTVADAPFPSTSTSRYGPKWRPTVMDENTGSSSVDPFLEIEQRLGNPVGDRLLTVLVRMYAVEPGDDGGVGAVVVGTPR